MPTREKFERSTNQRIPLLDRLGHKMANQFAQQKLPSHEHATQAEIERWVENRSPKAGSGNAADDARADEARQPDRHALPDRDAALIAWIIRPHITNFAVTHVILPDRRLR